MAEEILLTALGPDVLTALRNISEQDRLEDDKIAPPIDRVRIYFDDEPITTDTIGLVRIVAIDERGALVRLWKPPEEEVSEGGLMGVVVREGGTVVTSDLLTPAEAASLYGRFTVNSFSANRAMGANEHNHAFLHPSTDTVARTFTLPSGLPVGTTALVLNQNGAGDVTLTSSEVIRLAGDGSTGDRVLTANGIANFVKITTTEWLVSGVGLS